MRDKYLNASEAIYGLLAWLTTREEELTLGAHYDAAPAAELAKLFCETNDLPDISEDWPDNLIHPEEE